jgi:uncharacterized protein DUF4276
MVKIFIEGTTDDTNGDLREGFRKLFEQKLSGKMPRIILGDDQKSTVRKFLNDKESTKFLLIDLDKSEEERVNVLTELQLNQNQTVSFFMIQEMEAWMLSQPEILNSYYNENISNKIPKRHSKEISDPSDKLMDFTKNSKKGKYHKVRDGVRLLQLLNLSQLETDFVDVKNLMYALS